MRGTTPINPIQEYGSEHLISEVFDIPVATLRTQRSRAEGPPYLKIGSRVYYKISEVKEWMDRHAVRPTDQSKAGR